MNAVRQSCRPKHQVLILKCFPRYQKGVLQVKPNASELSYLLYYASTRRSKLQKVGAFLEKKAAREVHKGRIGNVQVVLQILTALIEKLPRELPLYAHSILAIIETVIHSNDITMVEETVPTFEMFCNSQDLSVLAVEQQHATRYLSIVRSYAAFASTKLKSPANASNDLPISLRWKNIGLKAIRSIVCSESISGDGGKQLSIIVPIILENLYAGSEDVLISLQSKASEKAFDETSEQAQSRRRRASTVTVQTVDAHAPDGNVAEASGTTADADKVAELEVRLLAMRCLERIFVVSSNRSQIRTAAGLVLQFIVDKQDNSVSEKPFRESKDWAQSLMELIVKWCPVQDRFIVLFTAVEILRGMSVDGHPVNKQIVMASLIGSLLKSPVNMIGLSVIDVLVGFVQHILRLLQTPIPSDSQPQLDSTNEGENPSDLAINADSEKPNVIASSEPTISPENARLVSLLKECIGNLATHIYYADQISDMIRTLLKRIRPSTSIDVTVGTVVKTVSDPSASANNFGNAASELQLENFFYSAASKITALEAVKDILAVANQKKAATGAGIESRNQVSINVWEGTQWLLRDPDRQVRTAYTDALVFWLQLETTKNDLRVKDLTKRVTRSQSKRDVGGSARVASTSTAPIDKGLSSAPSSFLQLLHLAIYDNAVEFAVVDADIFILHLLLVKLVDHLGVNATRFGLPMVLKLQEAVPPSESLSSADAQINIGSLVYGYLSALSEKFNFETSKIGSSIHAEVSKRKKRKAWLEKIQLPPLSLSQLPSSEENKAIKPDLQEPLRTFSATEELVQQIENAYTASLIAAPQSPPSSPGRHPITPSSPNAYFGAGQDLKLPADVKEEMLSAWSREACLTVLERERTKAASVSGSRHTSSIQRNNGPLNGFGNYSPHRGPLSSPDRQNNYYSAELGSGISDGSFSESNRDSTIRVNELKRMLTVSVNSNVRRSSPLRTRADAGNRSIVSSSSESLVSGTFSASDFESESRPQSIREDGRSASRDGSEITKPAPVSSSGKYNNDTAVSDNDDGIPPVPPLPSGLAIPGGFPDTSSNLSRQSSTRSDHPSPTGFYGKNGSIKGKSTAQQPVKTMNGRKSRSSNSLNATVSRKGNGPAATLNHAISPLGAGGNTRFDIDKLLDSVLPQVINDDSINNESISTIPGYVGGASRTGEERHRATSGIGRPPY
ncbi:hypothetical protein BGW36DRAFT_399556 [Talaromyces proteolyticus]|uniref:Protein EFR3 n=1 Tax=Talaromyces proteolyticus TaxID=1131652 RepID=A0AAD4KJ74_9EURO|nr:uncharacterized protein BGW36DRAFT_399556 [Talaromyces proteolyticus]KAH8692750.1 hypothetical protein BGW36DRAFT_399556 [Talaromyces proteolyticus]